MYKINPAYLLLLLCLSFANASYSQMFQNEKGNYTPPAPNAAALLEYASVPVNLSTGTPQVSVPLYELKGKNITVPISVSYHASGIKVQDMASSVGLGWVLNAGGVITRLVRGKPDEDNTKGYFNLNFNTSYNNTEGMAFNNIDTEPDLFYYNFLGRTGKMVLTPDRQPIQLPEQNLKIVAPDFSSADPKWEITDIDGVKYIFGKTSDSREVSTITMHTEYAPNKINPNITNEFDDETYTTISSWYLTEIIYPVGNEVMNFYYEPGNNVYFEEYSQSLQTRIQSYVSPCGAVNYDPNILNHIVQVTITSPKYISSISSSFPTVSVSLGTATFTYLDDRVDIPNALRLTQVKISNKDNDEIKKYSFGNKLYFVSDGCNTADCIRLKLDRIKETTNGVNVDTRVFQYNTTNLPSRKSVKYDHWGYYNNNHHDMAIPPSKTYIRIPQNQFPPISFPGAVKDPYLERTKANILTGFTNAAGGFQQLYYELNQYDDNGAITDSGGLRVSQIVENDGTGINGTITRDFKYIKTETPSQSSGQRYRKNYYDYNFIFVEPCQDPSGDQTYSLSMAYRFSSSCVDIFDIGGSHIGYSEVQVEHSNGSKEHLFFTNYVDHPDDDIEFTIPSGYRQANTPDFTDPDGPPFISKGDRSFERGLLTHHLFYNSSDQKVKEIINDYDFFLAGALEAPGAKAMILEVWGPGLYGRRGKYTYLQRGVRLIDTKEYIYDQNDHNKSVSKHTTIGYNNKFSMLVSTQISHLNDGSMLKEDYRYPFDYFSGTPATSSDPDVDGLYLLCSKNMASIPVEHVYTLKGPGEPDTEYEATGSDLRTFKRNPLTNNPVPAATYRLSVPAPIPDYVSAYIDNGDLVFNGFQKTQEYLTYDYYDNPLGEITKTGENVAYEWEPATRYTSVKSITKETGDHQHRTSYTYKPLVGLLTSTDPNGRVTSYEYDLMNRLRLVRENGEVVQRIKYHYKNQDEGFTAALIFGNNKVEGGSLSISTNSDANDGQMTYQWNFGDGTTGTTSYYSTSHAYASTGTYQVTVTKSHPEIGSSSASANVTILPPPSVTICADGPVDGDKCGVEGMIYGACTEDSSYVYSPTIVTATVQSPGCGNHSYRWEHNYNGGGTFGVGQAHVNIPYTIGSYSIRCIITDECGNEAASDWMPIYLYKSQDCPVN